MELSDLEVGALMELQYSFPITVDPYLDVAARLGVGEDELLAALRRLRDAGIIKRIGFYHNYRSMGMEAALVALKDADEGAVAAAVRDDDLVSHAYVRDDPDYNVWLVVKSEDLAGLRAKVEAIAEASGARGYVVLRSVRTFKLSVKYDLRAGVSRSGPYGLIAERPPRPSELGLPDSLPRMLRSLPIDRRPFRPAAEAAGLSEDEVVAAARRLLEAGVLADPGAALNGEALGFKVNGMVVMRRADGDALKLCASAASSEFSTHVVLREAVEGGPWRYPCYSMVHAVSRGLVESAAERIAEAGGADEYRVIYSLRDLKPGFAR